MRNCFNYDMMPIVQDNCISFTTNGTITTLPSNGYYGYQPPPINNNNNNNNVNVVKYEEMDVGMQFEECDNRRRFETVNNRKRTWQISGDVREFKKRRQNHDINNYDNVSDHAKRKLNKDADLFEELLKETHGCSVYHWIASNS